MSNRRVSGKKQFVMRWDQQTFDDITYCRRRVARVSGIRGRWTKVGVIRYAIRALRNFIEEHEKKEIVANEDGRSSKDAP